MLSSPEYLLSDKVLSRESHKGAFLVSQPILGLHCFVVRWFRQQLVAIMETAYTRLLSASDGAEARLAHTAPNMGSGVKLAGPLERLQH